MHQHQHQQGQVQEPEQLHQQPYEYDISILTSQTDSKYTWQDIDLLPDEQIFPKEVIDFVPTKKNASYYKRLRYALMHELWDQQRIFSLSGVMLGLNTNNYYALMLRKKYFFKLHLVEQNSSVKHGDHVDVEQQICKEFHLINCFLNQNSKEYQLWNYKKDIVQACLKLKLQHENVLRKEQDFLDFILTTEDPKNYHAWDYKIFLASREGLDYQLKELSRTAVMLFYDQLAQGARNIWVETYSLWSYRFALLKMIKQASPQLDEGAKEARRVLELVLGSGADNESAWNYLQGIVTELLTVEEERELGIVDRVEQYSSHKQNSENRFAFNFLLVVYTDREDAKKQREITEHLLQIDATRQKYYRYLLSPGEGP